MFVQIIEGRAADAEALRRQGDRWEEEVRPGAVGVLGVTSGVTADGRTITLARFESAEAAQANAARPEQGAWWSEMEKCYEGPVSFTESSDITTFLGGGSDEAGFVQVMKVSDADRAAIERLDDSLEKYASMRPDLLGGYRAWTGERTYVEVAYFTSEAEARAGEQQELPADLQSVLAEFGHLMAGTEYLDLTDPVVR
jgi:hypothetical protein